MIITKEGVHPSDKELRALFLTHVALDTAHSDCEWDSDYCEACKLYDDGCVLLRVCKDLYKILKGVVL